MGNFKKHVRPINKAKNQFVKWLNDKGGDNIDADKPEVSEEWDYYCAVSGFVGECLYMVCFMVWKGDISIDYSADLCNYRSISVDDFNNLMNFQL